MTAEHERLAAVEQNSRDHAKTLTEYGKQLIEIDKRDAVRAVQDQHLDERLDRIESALKAVYGLGKWLLATIGSVLVVAVVGFILKGGPLG